jgi:hypothetical protein
MLNKKLAKSCEHHIKNWIKNKYLYITIIHNLHKMFKQFLFELIPAQIKAINVADCIESWYDIRDRLILSVVRPMDLRSYVLKISQYINRRVYETPTVSYHGYQVNLIGGLLISKFLWAVLAIISPVYALRNFE